MKSVLEKLERLPNNLSTFLFGNHEWTHHLQRALLFPWLAVLGLLCAWYCSCVSKGTSEQVGNGPAGSQTVMCPNEHTWYSTKLLCGFAAGQTRGHSARNV